MPRLSYLSREEQVRTGVTVAAPFIRCAASKTVSYDAIMEGAPKLVMLIARLPS